MSETPAFKTLSGSAASRVEIFFDGRPLQVPAGQSVAAALLVGGVQIFRETPVSAAPRGPYCMMGVCFECLLEIDGLQNRQACLTTVREGMKIRTQMGARMLAAGGSSDAG
jgi:predicted molibdopterin-dependent oxidoreductase YjgC